MKKVTITIVVKDGHETLWGVAQLAKELEVLAQTSPDSIHSVSVDMTDHESPKWVTVKWTTEHFAWPAVVGKWDKFYDPYLGMEFQPTITGNVLEWEIIGHVGDIVVAYAYGDTSKRNYFTIESDGVLCSLRPEEAYRHFHRSK